MRGLQEAYYTKAIWGHACETVYLIGWGHEPHAVRLDDMVGGDNRRDDDIRSCSSLVQSDSSSSNTIVVSPVR